MTRSAEWRVPCGRTRSTLDIREQYEKQLKDLQEAYGEAMLELRARKKYQALLDADDK